MIKVYDMQNKFFRDINTGSIKSGFVLFERLALSTIEKFYNICGYFYLNREKKSIDPIDIQENTIAIPEECFCTMNNICRDALEKYNTTSIINFNLSYQFICLYSGIVGDETLCCFVKICDIIMNDFVLLNKFSSLNKSVFYPISSEELYNFTENVYKLIRFDYINKDYETKFKYVVDALIHGYHINFNKDDVEKYAYNISQLAYEKLEENYD